MPPESAVWTTIVAKKPLGPHRQHWFDVERDVPHDQVFSHVRLSTYPDGGLKRLRIYGYPIAASSARIALTEPLTIPALPLTPETFKPFGDVIQGFSFQSSAPKGTDVTIANQGTAFKFHRLAKVEQTYPEGMLKRGGLGVGLIRGLPHYDTRTGMKIAVKTLER
jgi:allantoicase